MRVYRHALESIFAMLELHDLSRALAVSRSWSAAVRTMKPIGATIGRSEFLLTCEGKLFRPLPPIYSLIASPLLRHLAAIRITNKRGHHLPLTSEALALLAQYAPILQSLWLDLAFTPATPLVLPAKLTSLTLRLDRQYAGADINGLLTVLTALPLLSRLCLQLLSVDGVDLSLLAASRSLTDLALEDLVGNLPPLSDAHVEQIRSSLGHLTRLHVVFMNPADLPRLLLPPVIARWQDIGFVTADARTGDLLVTLPTLTKLDLLYRDDAPRADFLSKLPLLSALTLSCRWSISAAPLLASLLPCTGLTELDLECGFISSQLSTLLAALTKLRKLKLVVDLDSLRWFASGTVTRTLAELRIVRTQRPLFPLSELPHLYALQRLCSLQLEGVVCMDDASIAALSPPTALLPLLTRFSSHWFCPDDDYEEGVDRVGPSWTQSQSLQILQ